MVVAVGPPHARFQRCLASCRKIAYEPATFLFVSDAPLADFVSDARFVNVVTHSPVMTSPAEKRDFGFKSHPGADIYAYLDDDAYAPPDWLDRAAAVAAATPEAAGFGGPGLMPDDQTLLEQVSAATMETTIGSGPLRFRFCEMSPRWCDDFPAFNLFVRRDWLVSVGGWATDFYGGEDTLLCARLADRGGRIWYSPELRVRHYRRAIYPKHAWQMYNLGRSRACFVREGEKRSRDLKFAMPLGGSLAIFALLLAFIASPSLRRPVAALAAAGYAGAIASADHGTVGWRVKALVPFGILIHHTAYAYGYALGLLTGRRK